MKRAREIELTRSLQRQLLVRVMTVLVFVLVVGATGTYFMRASHAATATVAVEGESGVVNTPAVKVADSSASGGSAAKFAPSTGTKTWGCITSAANGHCQFGPYAGITGVGGSNPYVDMNVWSPIAGWKQTLYANSPGDWQVISNMPAGNTAVVTYTNTGINPFSGVNDTYSQITSSFTENMHKTSQTESWAMYDMWLNDWNNEVMIQYDFANNGDCTSVGTATFGGTNGVPIQQWHLCDFGNVTAWKLGSGEGSSKLSEQTGAIDVKAMIKWEEDHGYLPASSTWSAVSNGWEISSTGSADETFQMTSYSFTAK